jgi:hypothetical protein
LLDQAALVHQPSQVFLDRLDGGKTEVVLDLSHGRRKSLEELLPDELVYLIPGLPGWRARSHDIWFIADDCLVCNR